ncbi:MAG: KamA family radical SAM protein [Pseudomonadota bacterium]|nr:KamA family radical SAM protein [Pseudomonadota bacterium]
MPPAGPFVGRPEALARWPWLEQVDWEGLDAAFPVRIPRDYVEGATDPDDPRLLTVLPDAREALAAPDDREDPVGDALMSPVPWGVQKHADRVLLLLTKRCHLYCRYCFRRNHEPGDAQDPSSEEWARLLAWAASSGAREAILSGGDPLAISDDRLYEVIDALRPSIPVIRIHTRAPITYARRITPELVAGLAARGPIWVLVHANHPGELTPAVEDALRRMVDAGLPVLNQAVLLAGVNDDVDVLAQLSERLVSLRVFPYYLHHPDHAAGNAHFRVDPARGLALHRALRSRTSGIGLPAYVVDPPDGSGKIPVEEWMARGAGGTRG